MTEQRKAVIGWALYDWANSAFATTVMAGFFPIFFKTYWSAGVDPTVSTARLGLANSLAGLLVALAAPILGAIADQSSSRKLFLLSFAYLGVVATSALFFVESGLWIAAGALYGIGIIAFSSANVFYDSLLPGVAPPDRIDFVSGLGFSLGYLGGGLLFLLNVAMTQAPEYFGLSGQIDAVRYSFLTVAVWWGGFTIFTAAWVAEPYHPGPKPTLPRAVVSGLRRFVKTLAAVRQHKPVVVFLVAYWFYIDGVDTIIRMAVDYGMALGFGRADLIAALLVVQFVGFPAALLFGKLAEVWGVRRSLFLAIGCYCIITVWGIMLDDARDFYILAVLVGLVQGGIQAVSRSYYARLIPKDQSAEFFGFYNMLGKSAAIVGPILVGLVGLAAKRFLLEFFPELGTGMLASRIGMGSILILFAIGALMLRKVEEVRPQP